MLKNILIAFFIGILIGSITVAGLGYHIFLRPSRLDLAEVRADAEEYKRRAESSEEILGRSKEIIISGTDKLDREIGTISEVIEQIRVVRTILQQLKENFTEPVDRNRR